MNAKGLRWAKDGIKRCSRAALSARGYRDVAIQCRMAAEDAATERRDYNTSRRPFRRDNRSRREWSATDFGCHAQIPAD